MNAIAIPFWGPAGTVWETSSTTTADLAPEKGTAERGPFEPKQMVFVVTAHNESVYARPHQVRYRVRGQPLVSQVFLVEAPASVASLASAPETFMLDELNPAIWRGFFPVRTKRRVLFTKTVQLSVGKLRRLKPHISRDYLTSEGDDG